MPALSDHDLSVEIISIADERFDSLCQDGDPLLDEWVACWNDQPASRRVAWSHPCWVTSWLDTYGRRSGRDYRVFFVRQGAQLVGVFTLSAERPALPLLGGVRLELLDDSVLYGADPTLTEAQAADAIEALLQAPVAGGASARSLTLRTVDEGSPLLGPHVPALVVPHAQRAVIRLGPSHEAFLASLSRNFRGNLRKAGKRLAAAGVVVLEQLVAPEAMAEGLNRFAAVEARSWKGHANSTMGGTPTIMALYGRSLQRLAVRGQAVVHLLTIDGQDVAAMLSHVAGDTLFTLKIGYDEAFAALSPGHMLLERVFREFCTHRGIRRVNLLTNEPWFESWRPELVQTYEVYVVQRELAGTITSWLAVPLRKRLKRWLRL